MSRSWNRNLFESTRLDPVLLLRLHLSNFLDEGLQLDVFLDDSSKFCLTVLLRALQVFLELVEGQLGVLVQFAYLFRETSYLRVLPVESGSQMNNLCTSVLELLNDSFQVRLSFPLPFQLLQQD